MKSITASICLQVSVHTAYLAWIKLDEFRAIVTRLCRQPTASTPRVDSDRSRARHERRGALLVEQVPDQYLAWQDQGSGAATSSAEFEPLSDHCSRITVFVNFEPSAARSTQVSAASAQEEIQLALQDFKAQTEQGARRRALR